MGSYDKALEVLDRLGGDSRLSPTEVDKVARERELLQITQRLLQEIGMPDCQQPTSPTYSIKSWAGVGRAQK